MTATAVAASRVRKTVRRREFIVLRLLVMIVAKLLAGTSDIHAEDAWRPTSATDIGAGLVITEAIFSANEGERLFAISLGYRAPMAWASGSVLYAVALPMLAVGLDQTSSPSFSRFAVPIGLLVAATEARPQGGSAIEAGIGGGLTLSGGAAEGVHLRPFFMAELGAAVFKNGGLRLRYMMVPRGAEWNRSIAGYHGLYLVFGATAW
jgi:hypothetical protein